MNLCLDLSNYKVYVYIVKHNYILGGMLFTIRKAQLHVSALNFRLYNENLSVRYTCICRGVYRVQGTGVRARSRMCAGGRLALG